jgi:dihydroflavonol-4-reductase
LNYLITGATGFIGPYLVKWLISQGHRCRCLARQSDKKKAPQDPGVELVNGDITDIKSLGGIAEDIDCLFHLATLGHINNFSVSEKMFMEVNLLGTRNIMREAMNAGVKRIVHCSSVAAMGICSDMPATEMTACNPHHAYGRSKLEAEKQVIRMVKEENLPAVIVRFSMVYGPGDPRDILKLTRLAKKGLFPKIGKRLKFTPLIHVNDAVTGLMLASERGRNGEIYLITNRKSIPFDEIRKVLQDTLGVKRFPLYVPEWAALFMASLCERTFPLIGKVSPVSRKNIESTLADRVFSIEKAERELGFHPEKDPVQGLKETVEWYMKQGWV